MSPEQIVKTPGALRGVAWLQAIRALNDMEFDRLTALWVAEELLSEDLADILMGIGSPDGEGRP